MYDGTDLAGQGETPRMFIEDWRCTMKVVDVYCVGVVRQFDEEMASRWMEMQRDDEMNRRLEG